MTRHLRLAVVLAVAPALLAGCSSGKSKPAPTNSPTANSSSSTTPPNLNGVTAALTALSSVHLDIDSSALGGTSTADVLLSHGKATAIDLHTTHAGQPVEVVSRNGESWLKTANGWELISPSSSNPTAKALSDPLGVVTLTSSLASVGAVGGLFSAAQIKKAAPAQLDGVQTTEYTLAVDPSKLDKSTTLGQILALIGGNSIPVYVWVDGQNRPVQLGMAASALGEQVSLIVKLSQFDAPLSIPTPS